MKTKLNKNEMYKKLGCELISLFKLHNAYEELKLMSFTYACEFFFKYTHE